MIVIVVVFLHLPYPLLAALQWPVPDQQPPPQWHWGRRLQCRVVCQRLRRWHAPSHQPSVLEPPVFISSAFAQTAPAAA
ncbi:MAG: hypothetical protein ABIR55_16705, partial [Burkholderiaceae bacterium]